MKQTTITARGVEVDGYVFALQPEDKWVTVDEDGEVWACSGDPEIEPTYSQWAYTGSGRRIGAVGPQPNWQKMKLKLEDV